MNSVDTPLSSLEEVASDRIKWGGCIKGIKDIKRSRMEHLYIIRQNLNTKV